MFRYLQPVAVFHVDAASSDLGCVDAVCLVRFVRAMVYFAAFFASDEPREVSRFVIALRVSSFGA